MRITFEIEKEHAVIALMYYIGLGTRVKSKNKFREEITNYFSQNGHQCLDDHEYENEASREEAEKLVNKYFK